MGEIFIRKALVVSVVVLFLFTGLSSVYAETVFNELKSLDDESIETAISAIEKITDRESLLEKYDSPKMPFKYLYDRIRKPTLIDGEDWDIVVPDDYLTIQEAVDATGTENGYRIYVRVGTYKENVLIDIDGIVLHGENKDNTVVNGESKGNVISIDCNYLNISGFTIRNSRTDYAGIKIHRASGNLIEDNIIADNSIGVAVINHSHANNITGNEIFNNNIHGISLSDICTGNVIYDNSISSNGEYGIAIDNVSRGNIITWNNINNNKIGVDCSGVSDGNTFHHNSLFDNDLNAYDSSDDYWDNGIAGNYWSDYNGTDSNGDDIGDTPYIITGGENKDRYPLIIQPLYNSNLSKETTDALDLNVKYYESNKQQTTISFSGGTIVVPDDYPTIQEAVDHAVDGDTIHVRSGTYYEHVIVDKQLKIEGEGSDVTVVDGSGEDNHVFCVNANNVEILDFTIKNCNIGFSGIRVNGDFCDIYDNVLTGCGGGVEIWETQDATIQNNILSENIWGLYAHCSQHCLITSNKLRNNNYGIELGSSIIEINRNIIEDNIFYGILQLQSNHAAIRNNNLSDNGDVGFTLFSSDDNTIEGNDLKNNNGEGISFYNSANNLFKDNEVTGNLKRGISLWHHSKQNNISYNTIASNEYCGIFFYLSENNLIHQNNIELNYFGVMFHLSNRNNIDSNTIYKNEIDGIRFHLSSNYNTISDNSISHNAFSGISFITSCNHNTIYRNTFPSSKGCFGFGIRLYKNCNYNVIHHNNFSKQHWSDMHGISIEFSNNNKIEYNDIIGIKRGVALTYSDSNTIFENNISDEDFGIILTSSSNNNIMNNRIALNKECGLLISSDSNNNKISRNNFINNDEHAFFSQSFFNRWYGNYWDTWTQFKPKIIFGKIKICSDIWISWINLDLNPAKEKIE